MMQKTFIFTTIGIIFFLAQISPETGMAESGWEKSELADLGVKGMQQFKGDIGPEATKKINKAIAYITDSMVELNKAIVSNDTSTSNTISKWASTSGLIRGQWEAYIDGAISDIKKYAADTGGDYEKMVARYWRPLTDQYITLFLGIIDDTGGKAIDLSYHMNVSISDLEDVIAQMKGSINQLDKETNDLRIAVDLMKKQASADPDSFDRNHDNIIRWMDNILTTTKNEKTNIENVLKDHIPNVYAAQMHRINNGWSNSKLSELIFVDKQILIHIAKWRSSIEKRYADFASTYKKADMRYKEFANKIQLYAESYKKVEEKLQRMQAALK